MLTASATPRPGGALAQLAPGDAGRRQSALHDRLLPARHALLPHLICGRTQRTPFTRLAPQCWTTHILDSGAQPATARIRQQARAPPGWPTTGNRRGPFPGLRPPKIDTKVVGTPHRRRTAPHAQGPRRLYALRGEVTTANAIFSLCDLPDAYLNQITVNKDTRRLATGRYFHAELSKRGPKFAS